MRTINTLHWEAGHTVPGLRAITLDNALLVKLSKYALKALLFVPYQLNRYLDSLDDVPASYRQHTRNTHTTVQDDRHRHIPSRVWQRRSALITELEALQEEIAKPVEAAVNVAPICEVASEPSKEACTSCSFNVVQVKCLPVWASNFSDMGYIE